MRLLAFISLLFFSATSFAQVHVVDMQKIIAESAAGKKAKEAMEAKLRPGKDKIEEKKKELQGMQEEVQKQSALLSEDALNKKIAIFKAKEKELAISMQKYQGTYTAESNSSIGKIVKEVNAILAEMAKEKGYSIVADKSAGFVLYSDKKVDLSSLVIEELNKKNITF